MYFGSDSLGESLRHIEQEDPLGRSNLNAVWL